MAHADTPRPAGAAGAGARITASGPGTAFRFVVGDGFLVALPADSDPGIAERLAVLTRTSIESLVALIPLRGADAVDSFAAVMLSDARAEGASVTAVIRGGLALDVYSIGGSRRFSDGGARPWLLADFRDVTAVIAHAVGAEVASAAGVGLGSAVRTSIVAADRLDWLLAAEGDLAPLTYAPAAVPREAPSIDDLDDTVLRPSTEDTVISAAVLDDTVVGTPAEQTIIRLPGSDDTVIRTSAPDDTVVRPLGRSARPADPATTLPGADAGAPVPRYTFRVGDGQELALDGVHLIGRSPSPRRLTDAGARLVKVASPTSEVSGTHLELRAEGRTVVVTDLHSTNGTLVQPPTGRRRRLRPGESLVVMPGTKVLIGEDTIVTISAAGEPPDHFPVTRRPTT
ncbi:FHA domain-containing protein [Rathayibacter sp. YIM 133350]|uniref:FHA domain-containing protein n=1 Tax=Rathayibacter sp. YIM 133350 TaxID=3131992 RepID=UPI00307FCC06